MRLWIKSGQEKKDGPYNHKNSNYNGEMQVVQLVFGNPSKANGNQIIDDEDQVCRDQTKDDTSSHLG